MPIYEYRCAACGHELEALQKFSDPALTTCPSCHTERLVKLVSAAGFQLKGTGWYVTDFRGGAKAGATKEGKSGQDGGDATGGEKPKANGEAKTETKPAAKDTAAPASGSTSSTSSTSST